MVDGDDPEVLVGCCEEVCKPTGPGTAPAPGRGGIESQTMHSNDARRARQPVFYRIACNEN